MSAQIVQRPSQGTTSLITLQPLHSLALDFTETDAAFSRSDNNLVIVFNDGGKALVHDFFAINGQSLPNILLLDGSEVSGTAFLSSMTPDMDLTTAAGPTTQTDGNGTSYDDGAGNLVGGLERLGSLDGFHWARPIEAPKPVAEMAGLATGAETALAPIPRYEARAVLYTTDADSSDCVKFRLLGTTGPINGTPSFSITDDNGYFDLPPTADPSGEGGVFVLKLSQAGKEALAAAQGGNIYDYLTITVNGHQYIMQVVVNQDGTFSSLEEDALSNNGANISAYEWHTESNGTGDGTRVGDTGNNEVWLTKDEAGATWSGNFTTQGGNDLITITNTQGLGIGGGGVINTGGGKDTVNIITGQHGMASGTVANAEKVAITAGGAGLATANTDETNTIFNAGTVTIKADNEGLYANTGVNSIHASGDVDITAGGKDAQHTQDKLSVKDALYAKDGENSIQTAGDVDITAGGHGLNANGSKGSNTIEITGSTGEVSIKANEQAADSQKGQSYGGTFGLRAYDGGENTIRGGGGVVIEGEGFGMGAGLHHTGAFHMPAKTSYGANLIEYITGDVTITTEGKDHYGIGMGASGAYKQGFYPSGTEADKDIYGTNTIQNVSGTVSITANHGITSWDFRTAAMATENGGQNSILNVGGVELITDASQSSVMRVSGGSNTIEGVKGNVTLTGTGKSTKGMLTESGTYNTGNTIKDVGGTVTIASTGVSMQASNGNNSSNANNIIENIKGDVVLDSTSWGMATYYDNANIINDVGGKVEITADVTNRTDVSATAYAMHAHGANGLTAHNDITNVDKAVTLTAKGRGDIAGMSALISSQPGKAYNLIENVGDITINATETWGQPKGGVIPASTTSGMKTNGGANYVNNAESLTINIDSIVTDAENAGSGKTHRGYGLNAYGSNEEYTYGNFIQGVGKVEIKIDATNFTGTYGMYASGSATNIIDNSGRYLDVDGIEKYKDTLNKALTVIISVPKGSYAMYDNASKGNHIIGSKEADTIDITGTITGRTNVIQTGAGDDTVSLYGRVSNLQLAMGNDGNDLLILRADNLNEFNSFYKNWIENTLLKSDTHGVNRIEVRGLNPNEFPVWLENLCNQKGIDFGRYLETPAQQTVAEDSNALISGAGLTLFDDEPDPALGNGAVNGLSNAPHANEADGGSSSGALDLNTHEMPLDQIANLNNAANFALPSYGNPETNGLNDVVQYNEIFNQGNEDHHNDVQNSVSIFSETFQNGPIANACLPTLPEHESMDLVIDHDALRGLTALTFDSDTSLLVFPSDGVDIDQLSHNGVFMDTKETEDTVPFGKDIFLQQSETVSTGSTAYDIYSNDADEFALVQQVVAITGG